MLPFTGLTYPSSVAVDSSGNGYVADTHINRVVKFAPASSTPTVLPSTGLYSPNSVAADAAGNVYVIDNSGFGKIVRLEAG